MFPAQVLKDAAMGRKEPAFLSLLPPKPAAVLQPAATRVVTVERAADALRVAQAMLT